MWKRTAYFAFGIPDQPGELANLLRQLGDAKINLIGLWGDAAHMAEARFSCVPESPSAFRKFFQSAGIEIEEGTTFYFRGTDQAGALVDALRRIADAGINIDTIECVASGGWFGCFVWAAEQDWDALDALLVR